MHFNCNPPIHLEDLVLFELHGGVANMAKWTNITEWTDFPWSGKRLRPADQTTSDKSWTRSTEHNNTGVNLLVVFCWAGHGWAVSWTEHAQETTPNRYNDYYTAHTHTRIHRYTVINHLLVSEWSVRDLVMIVNFRSVGQRLIHCEEERW